MKIDLLATTIIEHGAEVLELYCVRRMDGAVDRYRLIWADAKPVGGRGKCRILDVRDFPAANDGAAARKAFRTVADASAAAEAKEARLAVAMGEVVTMANASIAESAKARAKAGTAVAVASPYNPACKAVLAKAEAKAAEREERKAVAALVAEAKESDKVCRDVAKPVGVGDGTVKGTVGTAKVYRDVMVADLKAVAVTAAEAELHPDSVMALVVNVAVAEAVLAEALRAEHASLVAAKERTAAARIALIRIKRQLAEYGGR